MDEDDAEMWGNTSPSVSPPSPHPAVPCSFISTALSLNSSHLLAGAHDAPAYYSSGDNDAAAADPSASAVSPSSLFSSSSSYHLCAPDAGTGRRELEHEICYGSGAAHFVPAAAAAGGSDRRKKRMIKNRESAARSRARKQAYVNELEKEVQNLLRENNKLREQYDELKGAMEAPVPVKKTLQRVLSAPF